MLGKFGGRCPPLGSECKEYLPSYNWNYLVTSEHATGATVWQVKELINEYIVRTDIRQNRAFLIVGPLNGIPLMGLVQLFLRTIRDFLFGHAWFGSASE